jgi:four helix bundle protein
VTVSADIWLRAKCGDDTLRRGAPSLARMQNYRQLSVWRKAHAVALNIHRVTESIPKNHNGELISQIRASAVSIPTNIVEGSSRGTDRDFAKFVRIAIGSASEREYQLHFAADSGLLPRADFEARQLEVVEIRRMLIGLLKKLRAAPR